MCLLDDDLGLCSFISPHPSLLFPFFFTLILPSFFLHPHPPLSLPHLSSSPFFLNPHPPLSPSTLILPSFFLHPPPPLSLPRLSSSPLSSSNLHPLSQTIIECLRYITTGDFPPGSKGSTFVHDPKVRHTHIQYTHLQYTHIH